MSVDEVSLERLESSLHTIIQAVNKIPFSKKIVSSLKELRLYVQSLRRPRILLIGRTGSGKSSLLNAMLGHKACEVGDTSAETGKATEYLYADGHDEDLILIDTRGLGEKQESRQLPDSGTPEESLEQYLRKVCPDVFVFVSDANAVRSDTIKIDLETCSKLLGIVERRYQHKCLILAVLTKCDQVQPSKINKLPTTNARKNENLDGFKGEMQAMMREKFSSFNSPCILVSSEVDFEDGDHGLAIHDEGDLRWNIDLLIAKIRRCTPKSRVYSSAKQGTQGKNIDDIRVTVAERVIDACVAINGSLAASIPIPGASLPFTGSIQVFMVTYIGWLSGRGFSVETFKECMVAAGIGAGMDAGAALFNELLLKFLPGAGQVASAAATGSATAALGKFAVEYFLKVETLVTP